MNKPLLSICIPTYNRRTLLKECLDSVKRSWTAGVEIVISDNASTDGTIEMLQAYADELPLRWHRQEENLGFDRNCAAVVGMAEGDYCWVLGSDDCLAEGALAYVVEQLRRQAPDIFHFGYVQGDFHLREISRAAPPAITIPPNAPHETLQYLSALPNLSLAFAFISCFIFRKSCWTSLEGQLPQWLDSHYVHAYMVHTMLASGVRVHSSSRHLVIARGDNPNEWNSTAGKLLGLDARTMYRICKEIYRHSQHLEALGNVFRRSYNTNTLVRVAAQGGMQHLRSNRAALVALGNSGSLISLLDGLDRLGLMPAVAALIKFRHRLNASTRPL